MISHETNSRSDIRSFNLRVIRNYLHQSVRYQAIESRLSGCKSSLWITYFNDYPDLESILVKLVIQESGKKELNNADVKYVLESYNKELFMQHLAEYGYLQKVPLKPTYLQQSMDLCGYSLDYEEDSESDYEDDPIEDYLIERITKYSTVHQLPDDEFVLDFNPNVEFERAVERIIELSPPEIIIYAPPHSGKTECIRLIQHICSSPSDEKLKAALSNVMDTDDIKQWSHHPRIVFTNISSILKFATKRAIAFLPDREEFNRRCEIRKLSPQPLWWTTAYENSREYAYTAFTNSFIELTLSYQFHKPRWKTR